MAIENTQTKLLLLLGVILIVLLLVGPVAQNPAYHQFIDQRRILGIPNFLNVISNLPFLWVGWEGLKLCCSKNLGETHLGWMIFFIGAGLVSLGSCYYHWQPDNSSLVWDRLPMTIAFMGLFIATIAEHLKLNNFLVYLGVLVVLGILSVAYWHQADDLRPYILVQFLPMLIIPYVLWKYQHIYQQQNYLWHTLAVYLLAKVAEALDGPIYQMTFHLMSGHSLKHLVAAWACYKILQMLKARPV